MAKKKKYRGLNPLCHYSYNREYVDYDYTNKLSDEEKEFLSNFSDNYYGGRFKADESQNVLKDRAQCYKGARERRRDIMNARKLSRVYLKEKEAEKLEVTDIGIARAKKD